MNRPAPTPYMLDVIEAEARQEASKAATAFGQQTNREAQYQVLLDSHRAVMLHEKGFVMGWQHSSWYDQ